jgi:hypothetical protein
LRILRNDIISHAGNPVNEDIATIHNNSAWVMDGATGLYNKNLVDKDSDAKWFVDEWNEYLFGNIENWNKSLKEIIKKGISIIKNKYYNLVDENTIEPLAFPSSGIALVRWYDNKLEYLVLGDCTFMYKDKQGLVKSFKDYKLEQLDGEVISHINKLINGENISLLEARQKSMDMLIKNRLLKNTSEGYWILGFNESAADNCITGTIDLFEENEYEILLTTDGFYALIDKYKYTNESDIYKLLKDNTLDDLYQKIREIECSDESGIKYPRLKKSDDASAVYLRVEGRDGTI